MIIQNSVLRFATAVTLLLSASLVNGQGAESVTYQGQLNVGARQSMIVYVGAETGDMAAFCFTNKSAVGRAILAKCKDGVQCKFSGRVDWEKTCPNEGDYSARARILSVKAVRRLPNKR